MQHLSMTGPSAGVRFCGGSGPAWHFMFLPAAQWRSPDICIDCVYVYAQDVDEDPDDAWSEKREPAANQPTKEER